MQRPLRNLLGSVRNVVGAGDANPDGNAPKSGIDAYSGGHFLKIQILRTDAQNSSWFARNRFAFLVIRVHWRNGCLSFRFSRRRAAASLVFKLKCNFPRFVCGKRASRCLREKFTVWRNIEEFSLGKKVHTLKKDSPLRKKKPRLKKGSAWEKDVRPLKKF